MTAHGRRTRAIAFTSETLGTVTDRATGLGFQGTVNNPAGGQANWLFAVPDPDSNTRHRVIVSAGAGNILYLGRLNLSSVTGGSGDTTALTEIVWTEVATPGTSATVGISDHWHLYAGGYHWLSYTLNDAGVGGDVYLIRVAPADVPRRSGAPSIVPGASVLVYSTNTSEKVPSTALFASADGGYPTNDHFILDGPGGITVGIHNQATGGIELLTVDTTTLTLVSQVSFGGASAGSVDCATTSSGARVPTAKGGAEVRILAPNTVEEDLVENELQILTTDDTFTSPSSATATLTAAGYNLQMAQAVQLKNGDHVVVYKRIPVDPDGTTLVSDWGEIVLDIYDASWTTLVDTVEVQAAVDQGEAGNRCHLSRWGPYVIVAWDVADVDSTEAEANQVVFQGARVALFRLVGV